MQPCSDCPQLRGVISFNRVFTLSTVLRERWIPLRFYVPAEPKPEEMNHPPLAQNGGEGEDPVEGDDSSQLGAIAARLHWTTQHLHQGLGGLLSAMQRGRGAKLEGDGRACPATAASHCHTPEETPSFSLPSSAESRCVGQSGGQNGLEQSRDMASQCSQRNAPWISHRLVHGTPRFVDDRVVSTQPPEPCLTGLRAATHAVCSLSYHPKSRMRDPPVRF